ncbi:MAG: helix-turn-helix transcriptional regulator [Limnobacter sp.]|uniref:helix-turn-helix transcriptional regulator n=1 Tax=Limnobacter sp. TaxID=2003368 RepID=UPI00391C4691
MNLKIKVLECIGQAAMLTSDDIHQQLKAEGIDRDKRSIQRALGELAEEGLLVREDNSRPYRYKRVKGAHSFSLTTLKPSESVLLLLAERYLEDILPSSLSSVFTAHFQEARAILGNNKGRAYLEKQWLDKVRVIPATQPLLPPAINHDAFHQLSDALYNNKVLDIEYKTLNGKVSSHRVEPLGLVQQGSRTYLIAKKQNKSKAVAWAVHRIQSAHMTSHSFTPMENFNLDDIEQEARINWGLGEKVKVKFWMSKSSGQNLLETPLSADQTAKPVEGGFQFEATVVDSLLLTRWVQSYGENIQGFSKHPV